MLIKTISSIIFSCLLSYDVITFAMEKKEKSDDSILNKLGVVPNLKFMVAYKLANQEDTNQIQANIPDEVKETINLIKQVIGLDKSLGDYSKRLLLNYINNFDYPIDQDIYEILRIYRLIEEDNAELLKLLLTDNIDVNKPYSENWKPYLYEAVSHYSYNVIRLLISKGANVNMKFEDGSHALTITLSVRWKDIWPHLTPDIINLLLDNGADINIQNNDGNTALMLAVILCKKEIVELLLNRGASIDIENADGHNALQITEQNIITNEQSLAAMTSSPFALPKVINKIITNLANYKAIKELLVNKQAQSNCN